MRQHVTIAPHLLPPSQGGWPYGLLPSTELDQSFAGTTSPNPESTTTTTAYRYVHNKTERWAGWRSVPLDIPQAFISASTCCSHVLYGRLTTIYPQALELTRDFGTTGHLKIMNPRILRRSYTALFTWIWTFGRNCSNMPSLYFRLA